MNMKESEIYTKLADMGYGCPEIIITDEPEEDEKPIYCKILFVFKFNDNLEINNGNIQFYANSEKDLLQQIDNYFKNIGFKIVNFR